MSEVNIDYWPNGNVRSETYEVGGDYHREDGPALQIWYSSGIINTVGYYVNGELHRTDGPAITWYDLNGDVDLDGFFLFGKRKTAIEVLGDTPTAMFHMLSRGTL